MLPTVQTESILSTTQDTSTSPTTVPSYFSTAMQFPTLFALVLAALSAGSVSATPHSTEALVARSSDGSIAVNKRSGCGSTGPLGEGHFEWFIVTSCTPGDSMTCQATDASGCVPGEKGKIGSMEVDDPNDTTQFAKQSHTNSVPFTCPSGGQVRCQANFNDNNDGPNYSLRGARWKSTAPGYEFVAS
ncbi:hypothetical protein BDW22DRAFT_1425158 [Trametopsis cervina]|nr:hypothetical protein BDW22DRAFT_1425158 [Trametopsis cervina]